MLLSLSKSVPPNPVPCCLILLLSLLTTIDGDTRNAILLQLDVSQDQAFECALLCQDRKSLF